jgi:hypothetical protein
MFVFRPFSKERKRLIDRDTALTVYITTASATYGNPYGLRAVPIKKQTANHKLIYAGLPRQG